MDFFLENHSFHTLQSVLFLAWLDRTVFHDSLLSWRMLFAGLSSGRPESAGGPGGRGTLIFRGRETCFVSGKEGCPEYYHGAFGSVSKKHVGIIKNPIECFKLKTKLKIIQACIKSISGKQRIRIKILMMFHYVVKSFSQFCSQGLY